MWDTVTTAASQLARAADRCLARDRAPDRRPWTRAPAPTSDEACAAAEPVPRRHARIRRRDCPVAPDTSRVCSELADRHRRRVRPGDARSPHLHQVYAGLAAAAAPAVRVDLQLAAAAAWARRSRCPAGRGRPIGRRALQRAGTAVASAASAQIRTDGGRREPGGDDRAGRSRSQPWSRSPPTSRCSPQARRRRPPVACVRRRRRPKRCQPRLDAQHPPTAAADGRPPAVEPRVDAVRI